MNPQMTRVGIGLALAMTLVLTHRAALQVPITEDVRGEPPDKAAPRSDRTSQLAHDQLLEKSRRGRIDVYFVGDSIVRRWGALDYPELLANWKENFYGWNAGNFGWGADRTENILWRLEHGELDGVNPKVIVILGGTNNVGSQPGDDETVAGTVRGITAIVDVCRQKAPTATIILTAIFPRNDNPAVLPTINRINQGLAGLADGGHVRFLNINDRLADANGVLVDGMTRISVNDEMIDAGMASDEMMTARRLRMKTITTIVANRDP